MHVVWTTPSRSPLCKVSFRHLVKYNARVTQVGRFVKRVARGFHVTSPAYEHPQVGSLTLKFLFAKTTAKQEGKPSFCQLRRQP